MSSIIPPYTITTPRLKLCWSLFSPPTTMQSILYEARIGEFTVDLSRWTVEEVEAEIEYFNDRNNETQVDMYHVEDNVACCIKHWCTMTDCGCHETSQEEPDTWCCNVCDMKDYCKSCDDEEPIVCDRCEDLMCSEECKARHKC